VAVVIGHPVAVVIGHPVAVVIGHPVAVVIGHPVALVIGYPVAVVTGHPVAVVICNKPTNAQFGQLFISLKCRFYTFRCVYIIFRELVAAELL
jgi:hypothetical protein